MTMQTCRMLITTIVLGMAGILILSLTQPALADHPGRPTFNLRDFNASGASEQTMQGSIEKGSTELLVDPTASDARGTWQAGHGIRIQRAGADAHVHDADAGWAVPPHAPDGAAVSHNETNKREGDASVHCTFTGTPPDVDGDGTPDAVDLCEIDLGGPTDTQYDELRFWINAAVATSPGDLQILLYSDEYDADGNRLSKFQLQLPALTPNKWTEVFAKIEGRIGNGHKRGPVRFMTLRCVNAALCAGLDVHMDDFRLVQDLVTRVKAINGKTLTLEQTAERSVSSEIIYHDDTAAARAWLQAAKEAGGNLVAPAGTYYISEALPLYSNTHLRCAGADRTIFKNSGGSRTGTSKLLSTKDAAVPAPANIVIEHCGFDVNGWNRVDFLNWIQIQTYGGVDTAEQRVRNIQIRNNRFFDSDFPGLEGCDWGQDVCVTRQRLYISVSRVDGVWIENNHLSGGGRIKTGNLGLGRNMYIRNNVIEFVNDNAITITDVDRGDDTDTCHEPCLTEHVAITGNRISNPVNTGIFFGADGQANDAPQMTLRDVTIARNRIEGFFSGTGIRGFLPAQTENVHIVDNFIQAVRERAVPGRLLGPQLNIAGIQLKRADAATDPAGAAHVRINGNTILAAGEHAVFNSGGMIFQGPLRALRVSNNHVRCDACRHIQSGLLFRLGAFDNLALHDNIVVGATDALRLGGTSHSQLVITDANIYDNQFLRSTRNHLGQITIQLTQAADRIHARIANNYLDGGVGPGILCMGSDDRELLIEANSIHTPADQEEIAGCSADGGVASP